MELVVSLSYGVSVASLSFAGFYGLNSLIKKYGTSPSLAGSDRWKWENIAISWIHAAIIAILVPASFYSYPEMKEDLISHYNQFTYGVVAFSTGYFLYDAIDLIMSRQIFVNWPISLHHVVVLWIFIYNLIQFHCIGYTIVALIVEINSIFLHLRKALRIHRFSIRHPLYRINSILNLATVVLCRFFALGWISRGMYANYDDLVAHSAAYLYVLAPSIVVMWGIYIVAFFQLLKKDFLDAIVDESQEENTKNEARISHACANADYSHKKLS